MTSQREEYASSTAFSSDGSLERPRRKYENQQTSSSFPFIRPGFCLQKVIVKMKDCLKQVQRIVNQGSHVSRSDPKREDFSLDESKYIIRELAAELDRVVQVRNLSLLSSVSDGEVGLEERQNFILQWAEQLEHLSQKGQCSAVGDSVTAPPTDSRTEKQRDAPCYPDREQRWKEAKRILSDWTWRFKAMPQSSVQPSADVRAVLQDLGRQWRRGQLPNMLPAMDFILWAVLQEQNSEDSTVKKWLKSKQRCKNGASLRDVPNTVWKWILKASDEITLDSSTANPSLHLSYDRKRLRTKTFAESNPDPWDGYQRCHNKFDGWTCVQGTKGFSSGRHYWEVGVKGKCEWRIGVVKESAPRNGFAKLNTETGYWTLRLQLGALMALAAPVTKLNQPTPSRVGVHLDMEEGQVSFYDAEKRKHIYTFNTDFSQSGKIYPVLGTVETDRELVIL